MNKNLLLLAVCFIVTVSYAFSVDYDASFDSQSNVPTTMIVGKKWTNVSLTFKNTGTSTWTYGTNVKLGSQNPQDNQIWGFGRVAITDGPILPGQKKKFTFTITAPENPGNYNFQWQMLKEGVKWFGDKSSNVVVNVIQPDYEANFISQTVPTTMYTHTNYDVSLTFKNLGSKRWKAVDGIRLGSQKPQDNTIWGLGRVYLKDDDDIATGQKKTFTFTVTAPDVPGTYNFQWQMLQESVKWFGDKSTNVRVNVIKALDITDPINEENVSGTVPVSVNFTLNPVQAKFYVDGVLLDSVDSPIANPYTFYWDSTVNHLPAPSHPIDYGYYGVVGIQGSDYHEVDFSAEVNCYTNTYITARASYKYLSNWATLMDGDLNLAVSQGRRIELGLCMENDTYMSEPLYLDQVLDVAAPYWDHIVSLEIAGEPEWNRATTESMTQDVINALSTHGLSYRPLGVMLHPDSSYFYDVVNATGLDWIGIEAYLEGPGKSISMENIGALYNVVTSAMNWVPENKDIVIAQMSYNRNGTWTNMDTLRDLQIPTYLLCYNNSRVIAIRMFAYSRPNLNQGVRENPVLKTPQILVGEKILNVSNPYSGQGRRTLTVIAFDSEERAHIASVIVNVGQVPPTNACE